MPISVNPETADVFFLEGQDWKPANISVNPDTNEMFAYDGKAWQPVASHSQAMAQRIQDEIRAIQSGMVGKPESKAFTGTVLPISRDEGGSLIPAIPGVVSSAVGVGKDIVTLPQRTIEAAGSAPPGSRELTQSLIPTATETAALAAPTSVAARLPKVAAAAAPATAERLVEAAGEKYKSPELTGSYIKPGAVADLKSSIEDDLVAKRFGPFRVEKVHSYLNQLDEAAAGGKVSFDDFNAIRETFRDFNRGPDKAAAALVNQHMTNFIKEMGPESENVVFGNPQKAQQIIQEAHALYGAGKRSERITDAVEEAVQRAARTGSGANLVNTLRQEIGKIARNKTQQKYFNADELEQMRKIERGTPAGNISRLLGKFGLYHPITGWFPFLFSHTSSHKAIALMGSLLGHVSQKASEKLTRREIEALDEMVRSRSPLGGTPTPPGRISDRSMLGQSTLRGLSSSALSNQE